jgi:tagatose 6-phosphate kinase
MELIVTPNLALDRILNVETLAVGAVQRATAPIVRAGGKGVNIARAMIAAGASPLVLGMLGGVAGENIAAEMEAEGLALEPVEIAGENRTCFIINSRLDGRETVINEPGPNVKPVEFVNFVNKYSLLLADADLVICSGSLPPGVEADAYRTMIDMANREGKRCLLDVAGEVLRASIDASPYIAKVNHREAGELLRLSIESVSDARFACERMCALGARNAVVTLGAEGAVGLFHGRCWYVKGPRVERAHAVGSGDAFLAGLALAMRRGYAPKEMLRYAAAFGTGSARTGISRFSMEEVESVLRETTVERVK